MKKILFILLFSTKAWSACPLYTYPENPKLDQEVNNICANITNPKINSATISSATITNATITNLIGSGNKIKQIVPFSITASNSTSSQSFSSTSITASITPKSSSSTIYIFASINAYQNLSGSAGAVTTMDVKFIRGASTATSSGNIFGSAWGYTDAATTNTRMFGQISILDYDVPATTSATSYTLQIRNSAGVGVVGTNDPSGESSNNALSSGFLVEVGS